MSKLNFIKNLALSLLLSSIIFYIVGAYINWDSYWMAQIPSWDNYARALLGCAFGGLNAIFNAILNTIDEF